MYSAAGSPEQPQKRRGSWLSSPGWILALLAAAAVAGSVWIGATTNYGGDNDTYHMLGTFLHILKAGDYTPSRFTGYPVAEIGIGALAWTGGSALSNLVTYGLFVLAVALFPLGQRRGFGSNTRTWAFLAMALTAPVLAFDNTQSMDYSWALVFWVIGNLCLRRSSNQAMAIIPMALCIGSRPSFAVFVVTSMLMIKPAYGVSRAGRWREIGQRLPTLAATVFTGGLFYLPAWLKNGFGLSWISASPPDVQGATGVVARFFYKSLITIGIWQACVLLAVLIILLIQQRQGERAWTTLPNSDTAFLLTIIAINLLIFARIPAELSYLQPALLCLFYGIAQLQTRTYAGISILLASLNLGNWFIQPKVVDIHYRTDELCAKVVAEDARINIGLDSGRLEKTRKSLERVRCYAMWFKDIQGKDYSRVIAKGLPLKEMD
jgi:hypothetical protein